MTRDFRRFAPATERNREPIADVLRRVLPERGAVLEIAAGTGEHAVHFAGAFPGLSWQPSDLEPENLASIQAWRDHVLLDNLAGPMRLDVRHLPWPRIAAASLDAVVAINLIHISPWECTGTLMRGAAAALKPGGVLYLYGPYRIDGAQTAPSNEAFEGWLKGLDQRFGVRDLGEVRAEAEAAGLVFGEKIAMPANNFSVIFRKPV